MTDKKTSEAQVKASRAWEERNKEKARIDRYKRTARTFVRQADKDYIDALKELREMIGDKLEELEKDK